MESALEWQPIFRIPNVVVVRKDQSTYYYQLFLVNGLALPTRVRERTSMTLARLLIQSADLAVLFSREALELEHLKEEFFTVPLVDNIPDSLISIVTPRREIMTEAATELFQALLEAMRMRYPEFSYRAKSRRLLQVCTRESLQFCAEILSLRSPALKKGPAVAGGAFCNPETDQKSKNTVSFSPCTRISKR
ncbi:hypothetical protein [Marinobacterium sedimentorum]|uniref:hypothetical protein n=1 Tax=Marinobacterium sedimentorum TaxID=2927804 RepID=UPI0020C5F4B9|nr:hypothetical protein [Marinobacterium sedimentorum]MCP8687603.1 hypothetical protein [Marinobacterium sedimentorum]